MSKSKNINKEDQKNLQPNNDELFPKKVIESINEIESDGSASAFDGTESVNEDNFDNLSEK